MNNKWELIDKDICDLQDAAGCPYEYAKICILAGLSIPEGVSVIQLAYKANVANDYSVPGFIKMLTNLLKPTPTDSISVPEVVRIKYTPEGMEGSRLTDVSENSDWIDTFVVNVKVNDVDMDWDDKGEVHFKAGDTVKTYLGFALQPPKNKEADLRPRSSTFKNTGLLQTNSCGVIDNKYAGNDDIWAQEFYATRDGVITKYIRLGQFRFSTKQDPIVFLEVEDLGNKNRGGYGSTGK